MRCNNKHTLEENNEGGKLVRELMSYVDEIKSDYHENIASNILWT